MKYIIIDALLNGTGIRDKYKGEYIDPRSLGLSDATIIRLNDWLSEYWEEHYNGYIDGTIIDTLDQEGRRIAIRIQKELPEMKVEFGKSLLTSLYSNNRGEHLLFPSVVVEMYYPEKIY